jgi:hypothetical protein
MTMKKKIQFKRRNFIKTLSLSSGLCLSGGGLISGCSQKDEKKIPERLSNAESGLVQSIYVKGDNKVKVTLESVDVLLKSDEILNFPRIIELEGDKLVLAYGKGRHGGAESRLAAFSDDMGKTWDDFPADSPWNDNVQTSGVLGYLKDGTIAYIDVFPVNMGDYRDLKQPWHKTYLSDPVWRLRRFSSSGELLEDTSFQVSNLPWKEAAYYCYGDLLDLGNGELLCPLGAQLPDTKIMEGSSIGITTFFVRSTDNGKSFKYLSHIPPEVDGKPLPQGFNEPTLELLPDGEIICVGRTGGDNPLYQVRSSDNGATWTKPVSTGWPAAKPDLCLLDNGILACSSGRGRYGHPQITHAMFSLDGRGEHWEAPFVFHTGPGCSYTSNMKKNGKLYVAYSHSSFTRDKSKYNLPYHSIKWAVMKVERTFDT